MADEDGTLGGLTFDDLTKAFDEMHGPGAWDRLQTIRAREDAEIVQLCERMGYGRVMHAAAEAWEKKDPIGAHSTGPGVSLMVPCSCLDKSNVPNCDWCCGSGRVTRRVKEAMSGEGG